MQLAQLCRRRVCTLRGRTLLLLLTAHTAAVLVMLLHTYPMYSTWGRNETMWLYVGDSDDMHFLSNANEVTGVMCIIVSVVVLPVDAIGLAVLLLYEPSTHPKRKTQHYVCLAEHALLAIWNVCMCAVRASVAGKSTVRAGSASALAKLPSAEAAMVVMQADALHVSLALCAVQHAGVMLLNAAIVAAIAIPMFGGDALTPPPAGSADVQTAHSKDEHALHPGRPKLTALGPDTVSYDPPSREQPPAKAATAATGAVPAAAVPSAEPTQGRSDEPAELQAAQATADTPTATTPTPRIGSADEDDMYGVNLNSADLFGVSIPAVGESPHPPAVEPPKSAKMDTTEEESVRKSKPHTHGKALATVEVGTPVPVKPPPAVMGAKPPAAAKQPAKPLDAPAGTSGGKKAVQPATLPPPADAKTAGGKKEKSPFWKRKN